MDIFVVILRLLHIVAAAYWVGAGVLVALFVEPAAKAAGPAGAQFLMRFGQSKYSPSMSIAGITTIVAGFLLYWRFGYSLNSITGAVLLAGGLVGLAALIYSAVVFGPLGAKLGRLSKELQAGGKPPSAEQQAQMANLLAGLSRASRIAAVLLVIAVAAMAVARYL